MKSAATSPTVAKASLPRTIGETVPRWRFFQTRLDVVVERELPRVGTQPDRVYLLAALVADPRLDHVLGEDAALQQELVIRLQGVEGLVERAGHVPDLRELLLGQLEQVDV